MANPKGNPQNMKPLNTRTKEEQKRIASMGGKASGEASMAEMKVQYVPIGQVKPYENNPRKNKAAVDYVANSIKEFGWRQPIVTDKDFVIIVGHTRLQAAKKLKLKEVPVLVADDMTEEQAKAYRLADNKTAEFAEWDFDLLNDELLNLDMDMTLFGFEDSEEEEPQEIIEDEIPEAAESRCKLGDLWQLGEHRLICGDSTDPAVIDRLMDGVKADMVFCDAPYGYKYESNHQDKYEMLQNDDKILDFIPAIWGAMKDNCPVYEFCGWQSLKQWLEYFENTSLDLKNVIIWKKNNWSMGDLKGAYAGQYEVILYLNKGRVELNGARDTDIWEFDREPPKMHPTMKPIELIAYALSKSSKKGDVVLDCFGGSGSTLIACEQLNRKCYMAELDPHYCDIILERWETFTGEKAELID